MWIGNQISPFLNFMQMPQSSKSFKACLPSFLLLSSRKWKKANFNSNFFLFEGGRVKEMPGLGVWGLARYTKYSLELLL